ncbi:MAG TPA: hypothetical protein VFH26_03830 [Gemmatimonadales bacterium]|nr:hypothetical protein [Gemmatimonadales bacterium]
MTEVHPSFIQSWIARAMAVGGLVALAGCGATEPLSVTPDAPAGQTPELASTAVPPGIVFASYNLQLSQLNSTHTGTIMASTPSNLLSSLKTVKDRGGRVLLRLHGDKIVRNADGTFNLDTWKSQVARFRNVNFASYINDGTIVGHFIADEPHFPSRWGGKVIPQSTVETMAQYSKQLWPTLITITSAPPSWLASAGITYTHLDAGWAIYYAKIGNASTWLSNQVAKAKLKKLGLVASLNVLDGGNGSSGFSGNYPNKFAMSAAELRSYGTALLAQSYVCAFAMWKYTSAYYGRSDIQSAMRELSGKARNHPATSCRQ